MSDLPECKCNNRGYRLEEKDGELFICFKIRHASKWEVKKIPISQLEQDKERFLQKIVIGGK